MSNHYKYAQHSGSIASGGVAQQVAGENSGRYYVFFQNVSDTDMWVQFGRTAVADSPSIKVAAGLAFEPSVVDCGAISVICATAGKKFTCVTMG